MCLAVPGRIESVFDQDGARMGRVSFDGIIKEVCLEFLPEADVGDYALVHVGFAITKVDEATALASLATIREWGLMADELAEEQG